jgi:hypothetical protein
MAAPLSPLMEIAPEEKPPRLDVAARGFARPATSAIPPEAYLRSPGPTRAACCLPRASLSPCSLLPVLASSSRALPPLAPAPLEPVIALSSASKPPLPWPPFR